MLERKRLSSARESPNKSPPALHTYLTELPPGTDETFITSWQLPFMLGQPMDWSSQLFEGTPNTMLPDYSSTSTALPQDFSPASTLQEMSPLSHDIPLADPPTFPPFQFTSSSLSAALSPSPAPRRLDTILNPANTSNCSDNADQFHPRPHPPSYSQSNTFPANTGTDFTDAYNSPRNHEILSQPRHNIHSIHYDRNGVPSNLSSNNYEDSPPICNDRIIPLTTNFSLPNCGDVSSAASTPIRLDTLSLSPMQSPSNASVPIDLPVPGSPPSASTLFSADVGQRKSLKRSEPHGPLRLSSSLLLTSE